LCCLVHVLHIFALTARTRPRTQPCFQPAHESNRCTAKSLYACPRVFRSAHQTNPLVSSQHSHNSRIISDQRALQGWHAPVIYIIYRHIHVFRFLNIVCYVTHSLCACTSEVVHCMAVVESGVFGVSKSSPNKSWSIKETSHGRCNLGIASHTRVVHTLSAKYGMYVT